jgi:DNA-binding CsgD family transcriptional regulator
VKHVLLTTRQFEVAQLVSRGLTLDEVATALGIGRRTVDHHAEALRRKTGAATTRKAASRARGRGRGPRSGTG